METQGHAYLLYISWVEPRPLRLLRAGRQYVSRKERRDVLKGLKRHKGRDGEIKGNVTTKVKETPVCRFNSL